MAIPDWPASERPHEKLIALGAQDLFAQKKESDDGNVGMFSRTNTVSIDTAKRRMDKFVDEYEAGRLKDSDTQILGDTPTVLQALGADNLPLQIDGATVNKVLNGKHKYDITADNIRAITDGVYDPLAVFESSVGGYIFLTELKSTNSKPVVAAVHINKKLGGMLVNDIASVYEKSAADKALDAGLLRYVRNEKGLSDLAARHPELASIANKMKDQSATVLSEDDVVKDYGSRYARDTATTLPPIATTALNSVVTKAQFGGKFNREAIVTARRFNDLPPAIIKYAKAQGYDNNDRNDRISGVTYQGKIYLVQENISTALKAEEVLLHEHVYYVLNSKGKQAYVQALNDLYVKLGGEIF
ncbi:MAG: MuF-C-terminal domain-containing protein [Methylophilaceae bacterium]